MKWVRAEMPSKFKICGCFTDYRMEAEGFVCVEAL